LHQGPSDKHDYAHAHHWAQAAAAAVHTNTILRPNRHHEPFRAVTTQLPRPVPRTAVAFGARPRWTTATVLGWAHAEGHHACGGVGGAPLPSYRQDAIGGALATRGASLTVGALLVTDRLVVIAPAGH
jgi:hypothetical protein